MDYKDTLLDNLKSLLHDVISEDKITPDEIYACIQKTITESYYYHKHHTGRSYELMEKLHNNASYQSSVTHAEMVAKGYEMTADGFWIPPQSKTFATTIELDPASGECYMTIPPEVLERLNWTEGTQLELTVQDDTLHITKV